MLIQAKTLEQITTKNLVTVTVSQSQLELNFELILKALKEHDSLLNEHDQKMFQLEKNISTAITGQQKISQSIEENNTKAMLNIDKANGKIVTFDKKIKKIEETLASFKDINPQTNKASHKDELLPLVKELQEKTVKIQEHLGKVQEKTSILDILSDQLKLEQDKIKLLQQQVAGIKHGLNQSSTNKEGQNVLSSHSQKEWSALSNQLSSNKSKISQLQSSLKSQTAKFEQLSASTIVNIQRIQDQHSENIKKIMDQIEKLNQQFLNFEKKNQQKESLNQSVLDKILKKLSELEIQLWALKNQQPNNKKNIISARQPVASEWNKHPATTERSKVQVSSQWSPSSKLFPSPERQVNENDQKYKNEQQTDWNADDFKKDVIDKLKQQRMDFNKAIKRLDNVTNKKEGEIQKFTELEERILRLEHLIEGKIDEEALKKWMKDVEGKISYLLKIVNVEVTEEDACIARKNWICLSCDKKLQAYRGRVGSHLISAQLKNKGVDQQVIGGGMLFKTKSKFELPQFKK